MALPLPKTTVDKGKEAAKKPPTIGEVTSFFGLDGADDGPKYARLRQDIFHAIYDKKITVFGAVRNGRWDALLDTIQHNDIFHPIKSKFTTHRDEARRLLSFLCLDVKGRDLYKKPQVLTKKRKGASDDDGDDGSEDEVPSGPRRGMKKGKRSMENNDKPEDDVQSGPRRSTRTRTRPHLLTLFTEDDDDNDEGADDDEVEEVQRPMIKKIRASGTQYSVMMQLQHPDIKKSNQAITVGRLLPAVSLEILTEAANEKIPTGYFPQAFYGLTAFWDPLEDSAASKIRLVDDKHIKAWLSIAGSEPNKILYVLVVLQKSGSSDVVLNRNSPDSTKEKHQADGTDPAGEGQPTQTGSLNHLKRPKSIKTSQAYHEKMARICARIDRLQRQKEELRRLHMALNEDDGQSDESEDIITGDEQGVRAANEVADNRLSNAHGALPIGEPDTSWEDNQDGPPPEFIRDVWKMWNRGSNRIDGKTARAGGQSRSQVEDFGIVPLNWRRG
ncbi:MAG: hypothetical protein M1823_000966 [Watsoniomyces obsoletus]|nr:MAG: hypothetical protein M1823_000966 [Watsoniomyces obsoletus]